MNASILLIAVIVLAATTFAAVIWAVAERGRAAGTDAIKNLAAFAANAVTDDLIKRANETFGPVSETLAKLEAHTAAADVARAEESGSLKAQIKQLLDASTATQEEARKLSTALRRGAGVQGQWGEQMLRNVLEMAGLKAGTDFQEQVHLDADGAAHRPDVIVRLPGGGGFVIDAKCSLTAFMEAQDAADDTVREAALARHAQSLKAHVQSLSARAYWDQLEPSPDFVAMFVPGDGFLAPALERLPELMAQAMEKRVILVTPTTLFALCKAVAYGWRVENQARNAAEIAALGRELYARLSVMGGHALAMGKALEAAVGHYNRFVGSLETRVLTQARRFEDLQVDHEGKAIIELSPVETAVRRPIEPAPTLTLAHTAPTSAS